MYDIIYNYLISSEMLGGAMSFESTAILCRYLSIAGSLAIMFGLIFAFAYFIKRIVKWVA